MKLLQSIKKCLISINYLKSVLNDSMTHSMTEVCLESSRQANNHARKFVWPSNLCCSFICSVCLSCLIEYVFLFLFFLYTVSSNWMSACYKFVWLLVCLFRVKKMINKFVWSHYLYVQTFAYLSLFVCILLFCLHVMFCLFIYLIYCLFVVSTLHWHSVHSVPCLTQDEPLKRVIPCSSSQVLVMSLRTAWAWHGSETQRGQHSPSGTSVKSQSAGGQDRGQQSTSPCWRAHQKKKWIIHQWSCWSKGPGW